MRGRQSPLTAADVRPCRAGGGRSARRKRPIDAGAVAVVHAARHLSDTCQKCHLTRAFLSRIKGTGEVWGGPGPVESAPCPVRVTHTPPGLFEPRHHTSELGRFPYPTAGRCWHAALVEHHRDPVPRHYAAAPYIGDDGSEFGCPRVGARSKGFTTGLAGLRLPSDFHGFQGKRKTRAKGGESR
jgi:hypothetical protein